MNPFSRDIYAVKNEVANFSNALRGVSTYDRDTSLLKEAKRVATAIAKVESGGKQVAGASGEFGAFQFMPATWKRVSAETMGSVLEQTPENEVTVATQKIKQLLGKGHSAKEIALIWNTSLAGAEQPFVRKGVNARGVKYDSEAYANKVLGEYHSLAEKPFAATPAGVAVNTLTGIPQAAAQLLHGSAQQTAKGFGIIGDTLDKGASPEIKLPSGGSIPRIDPTGVVGTTAKTVQNVIEQAPPAVSKLISALNRAAPARKQLEAAYSAERSSRAGEVAGVFSQKQGQQGYFQALGKLKGELAPPDKKTFEPIKPNEQITQADVDDLFNQVQAHPRLDLYEKVGASSGLQKIFEGQIPQQSQLSLLEDVFGKELVETILTKRPAMDKFKDFITSTLNLPRTLITSLDMSAVLRQGILFTSTRPRTASRAFGEMMRQTFSQKNFEAWLADIPNNPRYRMMKNSGLYISDPTRVSGGLGAREEAFMSNFAQKLPWIKASERAYVSYLNKLRVDVFTDFATQFEREGIATPENLKSLANFVNHATGRGHLGAFERSAQGLNNVFFSPRLIAARFNMLNPVWYMKQTPPVRKAAVKTMLQFLATGSSILALAKAGGASVELDPRSTDFAKIRVGDTRWDIWGGFQQWVRVTSQIAGNARKSAKGNVYELDKNKFPFDSRLDVAARFFRGKLNPTVSLALELAEGQKLFGEDITLPNEMIEKTVPLYLQDIFTVINEVGPEAIFTAGIPGFFGTGVQHYQETNPNVKSNPFSR